ncbi:MAG: winged helix-turn-helix transcriptional regulator [Lachnospiraceae bacterium]|nr:winged helix-turn-helix transcriptional regulator [Lachnospiraceae bacterium]
MEVPIRVEYEITDSVRSLIPILTELAVWGNNLTINSDHQ